MKESQWIKVLEKKWIKSVAKVEGVALRRAWASPELQAGQRGTFTDPPFKASLLVSLKSPFSPNHRVHVKPGYGGSVPAPGAPYPPVSVQECDWQRGPGGI